MRTFGGLYWPYWPEQDTEALFLGHELKREEEVWSRLCGLRDVQDLRTSGPDLAPCFLYVQGRRVDGIGQ
jgi:hypothetical protein